MITKAPPEVLTTLLDSHHEWFETFNLVIGSRSAGLPQNESVIWLSAVQSLDHRLFSQITHSWSGVPLLSIEDAARRAAETTTSKGLTIYVDINTKTYEIQRPIDESY